MTWQTACHVISSILAPCHHTKTLRFEERRVSSVINTKHSVSADDHISRHHLSPAALADVLRYHVLLQFLSWSDLRALPPSGKLVTTLLQTTGRATDNFGSVNLTRDPQSDVVSIRSPAPYSPSNATILSVVKTLPYNVTIFAVNSLLIPYGLDLIPSAPLSFKTLHLRHHLRCGSKKPERASFLEAEKDFVRRSSGRKEEGGGRLRGAAAEGQKMALRVAAAMEEELICLRAEAEAEEEEELGSRSEAWYFLIFLKKIRGKKMMTGH